MNIKDVVHKGEIYLTFCFDDVDSHSMGVFSVTNSSTYSTNVIPSFTDNSLTVDGYNGKYYFNTQTTEKSFSLNCFIDNLSLHEFEQVKAWLHQDKIGKLILPETPFRYYWVKVASVGELGNIPLTHPYNGGVSYTGTFTLTFKTIGQPYGYGMFYYKNDLNYYEYGDIYDASDDAYYDEGLLYKEESLPMSTKVSDASKMGIYNPGTAKCRPKLKITPSANVSLGFLTITNEDTGDVATITLKDIIKDSVLTIDFEKNEYSLNDGISEVMKTNVFNGDLISVREGSQIERVKDATVAPGTGDETVVVLDKFQRQVRSSDIGKYVSFKSTLSAQAQSGVGGKIIGIDADANSFTLDTDTAYDNLNAEIIIMKADTLSYSVSGLDGAELTLEYEMHPRYI